MSRKVERHMSLRIRFTIGMGAMLLPLVLSVAAILFSHQNLSASLHDTVEEAVEEIHPVVHLQMLILQAAMPVNDYLIHGHTEERENFARLSREVDSAFQEALAGPFALSEERAAIESARGEWQRARALGEAILALPRPVGNPDAAGEMERFDACIHRAVTLLGQVHDLAEGELEEVLARTEAARQELWLVTASLLIVGLGMAVTAAAALAHSVLAPVHALSTGAVRFGEGELSHRVALDRQDELGQLAGAFNRMADQLEQSQAALKELAIHDSLTGLFNRREFERQLREEAERSRRFGRPFVLLMLDIDHFKAVNDTHGHPAGDEALRAVAALLSGEVRSVDTVARYGGEEFAVLMPETAGSGGLTMAERIRVSIASQAITVAQGQAVNLTVSIGVATFAEGAGSERELVAAADGALYAAKAAGRDQVVLAGRTGD